MTCNTRRKHVKKGRGTKRKIMRGGWSFADFMENMLGTKKEAEPPAAPAPAPAPAPPPAPPPSTGGRKKRTKNNRRRLKHKKSRHPKRRH